MDRRLAAGIGIGFLLLVGATLGIAAVLSGDDDDSTDQVASGGELGLIADGRLTVGIASPFPPFLIGEPPKLSGYEIGVVDAVASELALEVKYVDVSFGSLIGDLTAGKFDLAAPATAITLPLEDQVDFADPDYEEQLAILVGEDSDVGGVEDLAGTTVGARTGTAAESYANEETAAAKVSGFPEDADAIEALRAGKVAAAVMGQPVAQAAVDAELGVEVVTVIPTGGFFALALPQKRDALREAVNAALAELEDDGTIEQLYQRYFGIDPPEALFSATNQPR